MAQAVQTAIHLDTIDLHPECPFSITHCHALLAKQAMHDVNKRFDARIG
jgi:hypothetical protein